MTLRYSFRGDGIPTGDPIPGVEPAFGPDRLAGYVRTHSPPARTPLHDGRTQVVTRTAGYALNAVLHIAAQDGPVSAASVAETLDVPSTYLAKILNTLAHEGVLISERGRHGGFRLAHPPDRIRLLEVVEHFDGMGAERQCLLGRGTCSDAGGCPVHKAWREASTPAFRFFEERTVADVLG